MNSTPEQREAVRLLGFGPNPCDFTRLKDQKMELYALGQQFHTQLTQEQQDTVEGLVNFLDSLTDAFSDLLENK